MTESESEIAHLNQRIEQLEVRAAFQEQTIDEMNAALTDLWKQLEGTSRQLARLGAQMREIEQNAGVPTQLEPPPPHY